MITKPITLDTLKKNIITVKTVWKSDAKTDGEPDYIFEDTIKYYFKNDVLYSQRDNSRPSRYYDKRRAEAVKRINADIRKPKFKGYYDGYGFGRGTFSVTVTKRANPTTTTTNRSKTSAKKSSSKKQGANKSKSSFIEKLKLRICD